MNGERWFGICCVGSDRKSRNLVNLVTANHLNWPVIRLTNREVQETRPKPPYLICNGNILGYEASMDFIRSLPTA